MVKLFDVEWDTETALKDLEDQGTIEPGMYGWWQVWGASPIHIKPGDIILTVTDDEIETLFIEDTFTAKAHPVRVGIKVNGNKNTIGALCDIVLLRRGTHHTLAETQMATADLLDNFDNGNGDHAPGESGGR